MRKIFFALALLLAVVPLRAEEADNHFLLLDKDGNGEMSREESKTWAWPELKFTWADLNMDDQVSLKEFKSWLYTKSVRSRMLNLNSEAFDQMDSNLDGKISYREECWCNEDLFRKLDKNKDGFLTRAEAFRKAKPKLRYIKQKTRKPSK